MRKILTKSEQKHIDDFGAIVKEEVDKLDPIGLLSMDCPKDEYKSEIQSISLRMYEAWIKESGYDMLKLAEVMYIVFAYMFGMDEAGSISEYILPAKNIIDKIREKKMKKILVIDDDKWLAKDLKYFIEDAGHECHLCHDTDEIQELWATIGTYDIIILGLMMLKGETFLMNEKEKDLEVGEILYRRIRKQSPKQDIVILTSKNEKDIVIDIGITKFIQKPLTEKKLTQLLKYIG